MKHIFIALFSICALNSLAQKKEYGYVGGIRLDSIDAKYGQVEITIGMKVLAGNSIKRYEFRYGQKWKDEKEVRIVDKNGTVLTFDNTSDALNFFDFNGWELLYIFPDNSGAFILKKKQ